MRCILAVQLSLLELQRSLRARVSSQISASDIANGKFKSQRELDAVGVARARAEKRAERDTKKARKQFLDAVIKRHKEFTATHRDWRKGLKKVTAALVKRRAKYLADLEKAHDRERFAALKNRDESEYVRLLKEAKNERLLSIYRQTDQFMQQFGK